MMERTLTILQNPMRWAAFTSLLMFMGVAWIGMSKVPASETTGGQIPSPRVGFQAPDFSLDTLDGEPVTLSELRGRAVMVNLWAAWCPPCRAEMPVIQAVYEDYRARGLEVLAVDMTFQDSVAEASSFAAELELTFPIAFDHTGEVARLYLMRALPTTFFVDSQGVIQEVIIGGPMNEATIRSVVEAILAEAP